MGVDKAPPYAMMAVESCYIERGHSMTPLIFRPSSRLQAKLFLIVAVAGILALLVLFLIVWRIASDEQAADPVGLAALVTVVVNALWLFPLSLLIPPYCRSLAYEIQEEGIVVRAGVVNRSVKRVPYHAVTNIEAVRGPFDRLFGLGTLHVQMAGMSGQQGAEESLIGLSNLDEVYDRVAGALHRFRGAMAAERVNVEPATASTAPAMAGMPQEIRVVVDNREVLAMLDELLKEVRIIRHNVQ